MSQSAAQLAPALRLAPTSDPAPASVPDLRAVPPLPASPADPIPANPDSRFIQSLAMIIFEVIEGLRGAHQLGTSVTLQATRQITTLRAARRDQLTVLRATGNPVRHVGRIRIDRPATGIIETAAIVQAGRRARAIALRLEWEHGRWRATEVAVL